MKNNSLGARLLQAYGTHVQHPRKWWVHDRLRQLLGIKLDGKVQVTRRSMRFELELSDYLDEKIYWFGEIDHWTLFHARRLLRPGAVVVDIGANIGYHSIWLARALGAECRVSAIEPGANPYERLVRNIALNGLELNISTHRLGLSDEAGTGYLTEHEDHSDCSFVSSSPGGSPIVLSTLDALCNGWRQLDFIKMDVEGFEERVLKGAVRTLEQFRPIICLEFNSGALRRQNSSAEDLVSLLENHRYRLFGTERARLTPLRRLPGEGEYINVFALPPAASTSR